MFASGPLLCESVLLTWEFSGNQPRPLHHRSMGHPSPPEERRSFSESHRDEQSSSRESHSSVLVAFGGQGESAEYHAFAEGGFWGGDPYRGDQGFWLGEGGCEESESEEYCGGDRGVL